MTTRSAHATIKGYFYQFDHTIVQLLLASTAKSSVVVEGIEDIDLHDGDDSVFVQCKYYEGSAYNHSVIKDAVIHMLKHFSAAGCPANQKIRYKIYGHYKEGQEKLPVDFDLNFLKQNFLTYKREGTTHVVHAELCVSELELTNFLALLDIDLRAPSYDEQQQQVLKLLISEIPGCNADDAEIFYYPNAINVVQKLAIRAEESDRKITKVAFVSAVNRKEIIFSQWLREKFGDEYYARLVRLKHFKFPTMKVPKASRIFLVEVTDEFEVSQIIALLQRIGKKYSHVEHSRTPQQDRFCPYILLRGLAPPKLISVKESLFKQRFVFEDGYPFNGSSFYPMLLSAPPTKENLIQLKFIPTVGEIEAMVSAVTDSVVEIFDFFKSYQIGPAYIPADVPYYPIQIRSTNLISEII